jgi:hypothetical protein
MIWHLLFFFVALKIPTLWLAWIVWWAIKSKPDHETGASSGGDGSAGTDGPQPNSWRPGGRSARLSHRRGPHGAPLRRAGLRTRYTHNASTARKFDEHA